MYKRNNHTGRIYHFLYTLLVLFLYNLISFLYFWFSYNSFVEGAKNHIEPSDQQIKFIGFLALFTFIIIVILLLDIKINRGNRFVNLHKYISKYTMYYLIGSLVLWVIVVIITTPGCPECNRIV